MTAKLHKKHYFCSMRLHLTHFLTQPSRSQLWMVLCLWYIFWVFLALDHPFFWDTIQLASRQAQFFYTEGYHSLILPADIDSGHPPFFGLYLSLWWRLATPTLWISHIAMLPFLTAFAWGISQLVVHYWQGSHRWWPVLLLMVDPYFAAQSVLVSPDVVLIAGMVCLWWSLVRRHTIGMVFWSLVLACISMRGMMVVAALGIWQLWEQRKIIFQATPSWRAFAKWASPYLPAAFFAASFLLYHYLQTGWIGHHADSPWAASFERIGNWQDFFKLCAAMSFHFAEYGRFLLLGLILWAGFRQIRLSFLWTAVPIAVFLLPNMLLHVGLMNPRYLMPILLLITFQAAKAMDFLSFRPWIKWVTVLFLALGNTWIYPPMKSQGWDTTLAHWGHYGLRADVLAYLAKADIPTDTVGTWFPEKGSLYDRDLRNLGTFAEADLEKSAYILYYSVANDISDQQWTDLHSETWQVEKQFDYLGLQAILFKRK